MTKIKTPIYFDGEQMNFVDADGEVESYYDIADALNRTADLEAKLATAREALKNIACFDDKVANQVLTARGSFSAFDEPGSVEIARQALTTISGDTKGDDDA